MTPRPPHLERRRAELSTPALAAYVARTQASLDVFALLTIWLTVLPLTPALSNDTGWAWTVGRIVLSLVFGIDLVVRSRLSARTWQYPLRHPVLTLAVIAPPVRILFSLRLLGSMFARGNLVQFLGVAGLLLVNGAIIVFAFESDAEGSNIETIGESLWWAVVTVATVGYGDFTPVTVGGRFTAFFLMVLGVVILAVVTAQIASSFNEQAARQRSGLRSGDGAPSTDGNAAESPSAPPEPAERPAGPVAAPPRSGTEDEHAELVARLERIEALLEQRLDPPNR